MPVARIARDSPRSRKKRSLTDIISRTMTKKLRVLHVTFSDSEGGAFRAAYRVHQALLSQGVKSRMIVNSLKLGDSTVSGPDSRWEIITNLVRKELARALRKFFKSSNPILHSPSWLNSSWPKAINNSDADVVHLHWVQSEMLSIADIRKIRKPLVWTMHDMWLFCGSEHYTDDRRWKDGYLKTNRPDHESGFDLNRWAWRRKKRLWKEPIQIVCPSVWLSTLASESALATDWPVETIGYPIDLDEWKPVNPRAARELLGLPVDLPLILFGAVGGAKDPRKGFDLFAEALQRLENHEPRANIVVFGQSRPKHDPHLALPAHYLGKVSDNTTLRMLYSACDLFILPSRLDNLPLTAVESMACGTPVVGFSNSGLPSIVRHEDTGYLAPAFDTKELAQGIKWVLNHPEPKDLRLAVRAAAETLFDPSVITIQHLKLYGEVISRWSLAGRSRTF